jgi:hypothetical protein
MRLKNCPLKEFVSRSNNKNVIAYGAGRILRTACEYLGGNFYRRISAVVDAKGGDGKYFEFGDVCVPIVTLEQLEVSNNSVLLITPLVYYDIYDTLADTRKFDNIDCYIYPIMREIAEPHEFPRIVVGADTRIPKKIHCIWFGKGEMSDLNKRCIDSWHKLNPDYEIVMWTEDNYDLNRFPYAYDAYSAYANKRWALLADFARFDILYKHGGIYVDTDVEMTANWNFLLYNDFFGFVQNNWFGMGNGFGSVKEFPLLKQLIKPFLANDYTKIDVSEYSEKVIVDNHNLMKMREYGCNIWKDGEEINGGANLFPQDMVVLGTRFSHRTSNTIGIHHYERTWSSELKATEAKYTEFMEKHKMELSIDA